MFVCYILCIVLFGSIITKSKNRLLCPALLYYRLSFAELLTIFIIYRKYTVRIYVCVLHLFVSLSWINKLITTWLVLSSKRLKARKRTTVLLCCNFILSLMQIALRLLFLTQPDEVIIIPKCIMLFRRGNSECYVRLHRNNKNDFRWTEYWCAV